MPSKQRKSDAIPAIVLDSAPAPCFSIAPQTSPYGYHAAQQVPPWYPQVPPPFHNAVQRVSPKVQHDQLSSASTMNEHKTPSEYFFGMYMQKAIFDRNQREGWAKFSFRDEGPMEWSIMVTANKTDFYSEWSTAQWCEMMATVSKEEFESPWFVPMFAGTDGGGDAEGGENPKDGVKEFIHDGVNEFIHVKLNPSDRTFELVTLLPSWGDPRVKWTPYSSSMDKDINNALDALYLQIYTSSSTCGIERLNL